MRIHICLRNSCDWRNDVEYQRHLRPDMAPKVATWDATFRMPWREFRAALRDLALANFAQVSGIGLTPWAEVPDGALVVPVDDDDWFAPDLARWLTPLDDGRVEGLRWRPAVIQVPTSLRHRISLVRQRLQPSRQTGWICASNSYAIRKGPMGTDEWLFHTRADPRFREDPSLPFVPRYLSMQNRTLASMTSMGWRRPRVSRWTLLLKRLEYLRLYATYRPPSDELAWCVPYVQEMRSLVERLEPR